MHTALPPKSQGTPTTSALRFTMWQIIRPFQWILRCGTRHGRSLHLHHNKEKFKEQAQEEQNKIWRSIRCSGIWRRLQENRKRWAGRRKKAGSFKAVDILEEKRPERHSSGNESRAMVAGNKAGKPKEKSGITEGFMKCRIINLTRWWGYLFSEREFRYRIINKLEEIAGQHTHWCTHEWHDELQRRLLRK